MELSDYFSSERVVFLLGETKTEVMEELVYAACTGEPSLKPREVLEAIWKRERTINSWISSGIAIPHARLPRLDRFIVAVGLSKQGILYDSGDSNPVHLLFLILGDENNPDQHILLLAEIARSLKDQEFQKRLLGTHSANELFAILQSLGKAPMTPPEINKQRLTLMIINHALAVSREIHAKFVLVHVEALGQSDYFAKIVEKKDIIIVVHDKSAAMEYTEDFERVLVVPFPGLNRIKQIEVSILFGISEGFFRKGDRLVSVSGGSGVGFLDTLMVIDVETDFPSLLSGASSTALGDVKSHILERMLQIAISLASEGREGKAVGAIFVLGDYDHVIMNSQQMIINPFRGYNDDEKSILDPFLEETIKEFATIDGAFVITGDGVIMTAGVFLRTDKAAALLPGLGARHTAAAAITTITAAFSIVVSQSTGTVSVFRGGKLVLALERTKK
jgi:diadenylate cyclase